MSTEKSNHELIDFKSSQINHQSGLFALSKAWKRIAREAGVNQSKIRLVTWAAAGCSPQSDSRTKQWTNNYCRKRRTIAPLVYLLLLTCNNWDNPDSVSIATCTEHCAAPVQQPSVSLWGKNDVIAFRLMFQKICTCFVTLTFVHTVQTVKSRLDGYLRQLTTMPFCGLLNQQRLSGLSCFDSRVMGYGVFLQVSLSVWNLEKCFGVRFSMRM